MEQKVIIINIFKRKLIIKNRSVSFSKTQVISMSVTGSSDKIGIYALPLEHTYF